MATMSFTLKDTTNIDYVDLLEKLVKKNTKKGEMPNSSMLIRKMILRDAKKAGFIKC